MKALRSGDTLVVWRLDRLGRNLQDLIRIGNDLEARGIKFKSLKEATDTTGPAGKLVFHMFGALAEFERELVRERTLAGLSAARARGRVGGRPSLLNPKQQRAALAMMNIRETSVSEIARNFSVSRATLYNIQAASKKLAGSVSEN
ncbi:DNA invertase Pin-like site-specific DNA recombinase [Janthinobacterium sp. CAN_S7]